MMATDVYVENKHKRTTGKKNVSGVMCWKLREGEQYTNWVRRLAQCMELRCRF